MSSPDPGGTLLECRGLTVEYGGKTGIRNINLNIRRGEIHAVIGGCHLVNSPEERIWLTVNDLKELGVKKLGVSHCTGMAASAIMDQEFGEKFFFNNAGTIVKLP